MLRYSSSRHRQLMDASEFALRDATDSQLLRDSRIASTILSDDQKYREWELRHANLLLPVAEHRAKKHQIKALRKARMDLVPRRALFKYLRTHDLSDAQRQTLFRLFHSTLDYKQAILTEHRQYMLAVSSRISTDHIIDVMRDDISMALLRQYEKAFARYFEMKCFVAAARDSSCADLVRDSMRDAQSNLLTIRRRIETERPVSPGGNFDREELLSRSGRYEALNYLNA